MPRARQGDASVAMGSSTQVSELVAAGDLRAWARTLIDATGGPGAFDRQEAWLRNLELAHANALPLQLHAPAPPALDLAPLRTIAVDIACGAHSPTMFRLVAAALADAAGVAACHPASILEGKD